MRSRSRTALLAGLLAASFSASLHAADLFVPGDFPTIQAAIDAAVDDDIIHVGAGTWPGALSVVDRDITLQGAGAETTIVDGLGAEQALRVGGVELTGVTVRDMAFTGAVTGARTDTAGFLLLQGCALRGNSGVGGTGRVSANSCLIADNGSHGLENFDQLMNCTVTGNGGWGVVDLTNHLSQPQVWGSRFTGNDLGGLRLVVSSSSSFFPATLYLQRCVFVGDNLQLSAFTAGGSADVRVNHVSVLGGTLKVMNGTLVVDDSILRSDTPIVSFSGLSLVNYSNVLGGWTGPGVGNIDVDPLWVDSDNGDFSLQPGSPCIDAGNPLSVPDADGSISDMGAIMYHPWSDLGGGIASASGSSLLDGEGALQADESISLVLTSAPVGAPVWFVIGLSELGAPFKGGTFWPEADAIVGPLPVGPLGSIIVGGHWPDGLPIGFTFWTQAWWPDGSAVQGFAASNGLKGVKGSQP